MRGILHEAVPRPSCGALLMLFPAVLAALGAAVAPAHAQADACGAPTYAGGNREVLAATLDAGQGTVGSATTATGYLGSGPGAFGALAPARFSAGGRTFTVNVLAHDTGAGRLTLSLSATPTRADRLTLYVCDAAFPLSGRLAAAGTGSNTFVLDAPDLALADGAERRIRIGHDDVAPTLVSTRRSGTRVTLTWSEALDPDSVPPASAFRVTVGGSAAALAGTDPVTVSGREVTLNFAEAPTASMMVAYTAPAGAGAKPLRDLRRNPAASFAAPMFNHAPTAPPETFVTLDEDTRHVLRTADFGFSDADEGDAFAGIRISRLDTSTVQLGSERVRASALTLDGEPVERDQVVSKADIDAGKLVLTPAANLTTKPGGNSPFLAYRVSDGKEYSAATSYIRFRITPVPDPTTWRREFVNFATGSDRTPGATVQLNVTAIEDADGVPASVNYRLQRVDADGVSNPVDLGSGTVNREDRAVNYTLVTADVGKRIRGIVSFTDVGGEAVRLVSYATGVVHAQGTTDVDPEGANATVTLAEDGSYTFRTSDFGFTDRNPEDVFVLLIVDTLPGAGTLTLGNRAVAFDPDFGANVHASDISAGLLTYTPAADGHGNPYTSFAFTVGDGADVGDDYTMTIDVTPVNDAPTGRPAITGTRQVGQTLAVSTAGIADADGLPAAFDYQWVRTGADGASGPTDISEATDPTYTLTPDDVGKRIAVRVSFTDDDDTTERVTSDATGTVQASGATNSAPTAADKTVTTPEDVPYTFEVADFGFADRDNGDNRDTLQSVTVVTLPSEGTLTLGGAALAAGGTASATDIALGHFLFTPDPNAHGAGHASFTFKVSDGTADSASAYTMTVDVTSVNDTPTGRPTVSGRPRVGQVLRADSAGMADVEGMTMARAGAAGHALAWQWVRVDADGTSNPTDITNATSSSYELTAADAADGGKRIRVKVSYTDDAGTAEGPVESDPWPTSGTVKTTEAANTAPTGTSVRIWTGEETDYVFEARDFGFSDADAGDTLAKVKVATLPGKGALTLAGTAVTADQEVTVGDIDAGKLKYNAQLTTRTGYAKPAAAYASFTFKVSDGTADSASASTVTFDIPGRPYMMGVPRVPARLLSGVEFVLEDSSEEHLHSPAFDFQWVRVDGTTETDIPGATSLVYHLQEADAGKKVKVKATFTDARGRRVTAVRPFPESGTILPADPACAAPAYDPGTVEVWKSLLYVGNADDINLGTLRFGTQSTFQSIDDLPFGLLTNKSLRIGSTSHEIGTVDATSGGFRHPGGALEFEISPVPTMEQRQKLVLHVCDRPFALRDAELRDNGALPTWTPTNNMDWSTTALRTLRMSYDEAPPTLVSTRRSGAKVMLTFSEGLDADSVPAASAFAVSVGGTAASLASSGAVAVSGDTVTLTLASAPAATAVPTARYTKPTGTGAKPLRDLAHNEVATFGARSANRRPTIPNRQKVLTITEDTPYVLGASDFSFADADAGDALASVRITLAFYLHDDLGELVLDGVTVPQGTVISRADIDAGRLRYVTPPNFGGIVGKDRLRYTVSDGKDESTNDGALLSTVIAVNDPPTGKPVISGTRRVGQVLTAATDGIDDPDGAPSGGFRFTYQWIQVDADGASNPTEISDATSSTYTLTPDDVGERIAVRVSFTDDDDTTERVTSDATGTVQASGATNMAPTGAHKTVTTAEDTSHVFQIADFGFTDSNAGDTLQNVTVVTAPSEGTLTVGGAALAAGGSASATDIALGRFLFTPAAHAHGDPYASFTFKVSDGTDLSAAAYTMTVDVTSVNDPPTGRPEIMGTRQVGQTLTASTDGIDDAEGLPVTLGYQWVRVDADGTSNAADISGATSATYTPGTDDLGKRLRVRVSFTDLEGNAETVSSTLTGAIQASGTANAAPTAADFTILASIEPGYTFRTADFGFADTNTGDVLTSVTVVTVPRLGRLALGATAVRPGQVVTASDIGAGRLTYAPMRGGRRNGYASFTFRVSDGSDESASSYTTTIDAVSLPNTGGVARVPGTLSADTDDFLPAGITVTDGFDYQWVRVDGSTETDIAGATQASYTLTPADTGKRVRVKVLFDDPRGVRITATSWATDTILAPAACAMPVLAGGATQVWSSELEIRFQRDIAIGNFWGYGGETGSLSDDEVAVGTSRYTVEEVSEGRQFTNERIDFKTNPALHGAHRQRLVLHICDAALALRDATASGGTYTWLDTGLDWNGDQLIERDLYLSYDDAAPTLSESARTGAAVTLTFSEALDSGAVPAASAFGITVNGTAATLAATTPVAIADETVTLTLASTPPVGATVAVTYTKPATGDRLRDPAHNDVATFTEEIVVAANSELGALSLSDGRLDPLFDPAHATYAASVDHATARITVTASARHPEGTLEFLDSADAALADADTATDGHQADLVADAPNTIKIRVTSGDGARTSTYTLTVTRKGSGAPSMPRDFTAAAAPGKAYLAWRAPATDGGSAIARYEYRQRVGTASYPATWTQVADGADPGTSAADERFVTVTGLANDEPHTFELRAVNAVPLASAAAESATVTPKAGHDCGVPDYPAGHRQVLVAQMVSGTGDGTVTGSSLRLRGFLAGPGGFGTLSATTFTLGADTYALDFVGESPSSDDFFLSMDRFPTDAQLRRLTVYVCRKAYTLIDDPKVDRYDAPRTFGIDQGEIGLDDRPIRVVRIAYQADATDATLGSLALVGATLDPAFAPATETYAALAGHATESVTVAARPAEPGATLEYLDGDDQALADADANTDGHQVALDPGENVIRVKVTATDTTTMKTYTVTVTRASADATLRTLDVSPGTLAPVFDAETTEYTASLYFSEEEVTVTAEANHEGATVEHLDASDTAIADADPDADGHQVALDTGDNVIKVKVTATDMTTTMTYTVTVTRAATASGDATLRALAASPGTLAPPFDAETMAYGVSVGSTVTQVTVTAEATHRVSTVEYLDAGDMALADADAETDGHQVTLGTDETVVKVKVTAEDGTTTKTYTLRVTRLSADAALSGLAVSPGTLDPAFDAETTAYDVSVIFSHEKVTVTAEPGDPGATVEYLDASDTAIADADTETDGHQVALGMGANTVKVKVTAGDGTTTRTYTVTVTRAATKGTDATLGGLAVSPGTLDPAFAAATTAYDVPVANTVAQVTVTPEANHEGATVEYLDDNDTAIADADGMEDGQQVDLEVGDNVVKVKVTAEDGTTTETYTVTVTRAQPPACPAPDLDAASREAVWTAEVGVGELKDTLPDDTTGDPVEGTVAWGYESWGEAVGTLSRPSPEDPDPSSFTLAGRTYDVSAVLVYEDREWESSRLLYGYDQGALLLVLEDMLVLKDAEDNDAVPTLTLHVCDEPFTFTGSAFKHERFDEDIHAYSWAESGLDWSMVRERTVTLSRPTASDTAQAGPAVAGLPEVSAPADEEGYAEEERIEARVAFDVAVTVDTTEGTPTLGLALGGVRREATYESGSGTTELLFAYAAVEADAGAGQAKAIASGIVLNGATVRDGDGTDAALGFGEAPGVASVEIGDPPGDDGAWDPDEALEVTLVFEEPVEVDTDGGTPSVRALAGAGEQALAYARGSGTDRLVFAWTLAKADGRVTSVLVLQDSLALNDGTIRSTAGLDATITHNGAARAIGAREALPVVSVADAEAAEGGTLGFVVTLVPAAASTVTVDWATADGTATAGTDYAAASGTLTFAPGETGKKVSVAATADEEASEAAETLTVTLSNASGATIGDGEATGTITEPGGPAAFTGAFANAPPEHDGTNAFTLEFLLSERPRGLGWRTVKDHLFDVGGGAIARVGRIEGRVRNTAWLLTVAPAGNGKVTLALKAAAACESEHDVCTDDGRMLEGGPTATVPGPAALSVADATADEEPGATLDFEVTLDRARHAAVTVNYATGADGDTATAGSDYTAASGTITFAAGTTSRTVKVTVLDDAHDDGGETMTFKLSNPQGARIEDGEATGTIRNTDAMPRAWLARFGRTVAEHSVDAVRERMSADRAPGFRGRIAGEALPDGTGTDAAAAPPGTETADAADARIARAGNPLAIPEFTESERRAFLALLAPAAGEDGEDGEDGTAETRSGTAEEAMLGTAFEIARQTDGGLSLGLWGRVARSGLEGRQGEMTLDGEVTSAMLGTDWRRRDALFGLMLFRSRGEGGFSGQSGAGRIEADLSGLVPWAGRRKDGSPTVWGAAGTGRGEMRLALEGADDPLVAGLSWSMAAAGAEGAPATFAALGGAEIRWRADGLLTRTGSEAVRPDAGNPGAGSLAATSAETTRLRLGLEAAWARTLASGATMAPRLEIGLRHDGGDAETGFGVEAGGGVRYRDPGSGLSVSLDGRALALHEDRDARDWGLSVSLGWDPRPETRLGPSVIATRGWGGAPSGGVAALLDPEAIPGAEDADGGGSGGLGLEMAWGTDLSGWRHGMTGSAYGRVSGGGDAEEVRLGWRLAPDAGLPERLSHDFWLEPGTDGDAGIGAGLSWSGERRRVRSSTGIDLGASEAGGLEAGFRLSREW